MKVKQETVTKASRDVGWSSKWLDSSDLKKLEKRGKSDDIPPQDEVTIAAAAAAASDVLEDFPSLSNHGGHELDRNEADDDDDDDNDGINLLSKPPAVYHGWGESMDDSERTTRTSMTAPPSSSSRPRSVSPDRRKRFELDDDSLRRSRSDTKRQLSFSTRSKPRRRLSSSSHNHNHSNNTSFAEQRLSQSERRPRRKLGRNASMRSLTSRQSIQLEDRLRALRKRKREKKQRRQKKIVLHFLQQIQQSDEKYTELFGESDSDIDSQGENEENEDSKNKNNNNNNNNDHHHDEGGGGGGEDGFSHLLSWAKGTSSSTLPPPSSRRLSTGSDEDDNAASVLGRFMTGMAHSMYGLGQEMVSNEAKIQFNLDEPIKRVERDDDMEKAMAAIEQTALWTQPEEEGDDGVAESVQPAPTTIPPLLVVNCLGDEMSSKKATNLSFNDAEMVSAPQAPPPLPRNSSSSHNTGGSSSSGGGTSDSRTSFTADTPYYTSYVENEMRQLRILNETLMDVSSRAKTFGKCGALMAEATRRLALACRLRTPGSSSGSGDEMEEAARAEREDKILQERKEAVGDDMGMVLSTLGEVLDEIADAQVQMCESLEASLSLSLDAFCGTELAEVTKIQAQAEHMTEAAENTFSKYLNGRHASSSSDPVDSWNKLSDQIVSSTGMTFKWRGGSSKDEGHTDRLGLKNWRSHNSGSFDENSRRSRNRKDEDPHTVMATTAANLRLTLEQIRLAQTSAELKRFQLLKKLVSIKKRRNFELGESALASLHGIRAYFHHCSDLVQGLTPRLTRIQTAQKTSREKHNQQQLPWDARENGLIRAMDSVGQAVAHSTSLAEMIAAGEISSPETQSLEQLEGETQIWELPRWLADASRYQREPAPGVLVEGWLYKKSSTRMSLQPWNKRWFMMDRDGIYYFRSSSETRKSTGYLHTLERVKICDIVLCTVREITNDSYRFCFEIVTPSQRPLMLQARGPLEYKMWVEGIRTAIETRLVSGVVDPNALMQGIGKKTKKKKRGDGVPDQIPTLASMLEAETLTQDEDDEDIEQSSRVPMPQFKEVDFQRHQSDDEVDDDDNMHNELKSASAEQDLVSPPKNPLVQQILDANPTCADCGAPDPDWASLNLGVLVCIECSGVHRSLGVHLSKVRSLKLDSLSESEARLLLAMGNAAVNQIWESGVGLQQGWTKPTPDATRQVKENWIKSKYQWKGFLEVRDGAVHNASQDLFDAARDCNLAKVAEALAYGGKVEYRNTSDAGRTALHICAASKRKDKTTWRGIECAELLLQNGAKIDAMDDNTQTVLDCAVIGNGEREMVEYLSARLS